MKFELTKIDPKNASIEEIKAEINRLESIKDEYNGLQMAIKIFINSVYGATASVYFFGYNVNIAEAITLQGQNIIHFANNILDHYFLKLWHKDKDLHKALGLTHVMPISEKSLIVYNDTDSTYMTFKPVIDSCDWKGKPLDLILQIQKLRLEKWLNQKFDEYAKEFNTENLQVFELEKISRQALLLAKKKYVLDLAWKDPGIEYEPQEKLSFTGVEIAQGSSSKFMKKYLKEIILYIFQHGNKINYSDLIKMLKKYKEEFLMKDLEYICKTVGIGDYEKYVIEDKNKIVLADKCPINIRAAATYNHILLNSKYKNKYNLIKTGDKIKLYYTKDQYEVFGFLPFNFPYEFASEINYDLQFEKTIIDPVNRFITAIGLQPVNGNLIYAKTLF